MREKICYWTPAGRLKVLFGLIQLISSTRSKFDVWPNRRSLLNWGRPKLEFSSSHEKFDVWPRPDILCNWYAWGTVIWELSFIPGGRWRSWVLVPAPALGISASSQLLVVMTVVLYSNHTETIIKYFVTNLNDHKTQNRSGHLVYWSSERKALQKQHFMISFTNSEKITTVNKIKN